MLNYTRIPAPRVTLVDPQTGIVANEWFRFFNNLYTIAYAGANTITPGTYGSATNVAQLTVNEFGGLTALSNVPIAIDANQIVSGNIDTARIQGAYTGITGVGTITLGTWNATSITTTYGGTGLTSYAVGDINYYSTGTALSRLTIGTSTYMLTSSGTAPQWTDPATVTVGKTSNLAGGLANQIPYQTAPNITAFNAGLQFDGTNFTTTGYATATSFIPSSATVPTNGFYLPAANSIGIATNTTERLRAHASGGISIGNTTDSGLASLNVSGSINGGYKALTAGTTAMAFGLSNVVRVTPNATATYTSTVPAAGAICVLSLLTSGTTSYTITFGTGFKSTGTLATGTVTARYFNITFVSDGTNLIETSRTVAIA